ncbi:MAG: tRNA (guanosine(46)-N7)-methyltransferase TrmB [Cucumibacter sp.]
MAPASAASPEKRAFFGRRKGHRLHPGQQRLIETLLPSLLVDPVQAPIDATKIFGGPRPLFLEIGYGGGEHLFARATERPEAGFIGCEPYLGGIGKLLARIASEKLDNMRLFTDDALLLLPALAPASLDGVFLLYPDPWPKKRHHKRRFVSHSTLGELARSMKPGGEFRFATDIEDYANWTLAQIVRSSDFAWSPGRPRAWREPWPDYAPTRYEQKARQQGRAPFYFSFSRRPLPAPAPEAI